MMKKFYQVANLVFTISGNDGGYFNALTAYFSEKEIQDCQEQPMLDIVVTDAIDDEFLPECFSLAGKISFNHTAFRVRKKQFTYVVSNLFDKTKTTRLLLKPNVSGLMLKSMIASSEVDTHNQYCVFANALANYSCLWMIFAVTLMKKESVFIHCGMMSQIKNKSGVVLTGTGGCGKTSIMMELISTGDYNYMAEDFGIIGQDGSLYDMQKKAAIYQSDVKWGNKYLKNAVVSLPIAGRIEWQIKKLLGRNPRHFFKPSEIFGNDIEHKTHLNKIYYLKRATKDSPILCQKVLSPCLAERAKSASFRELNELYEILCNIRAVGGECYYDTYPSIYELEQLYVSILGRALNNVECFELSVPLNLNPKDVVKYIVD